MKKVAGIITMALLLCLCMGVYTQAAPDPSQYYEISLSVYTEVSATSTRMGGIIEDWQTDVYPGNTVEASIKLKPGVSSGPAVPSIKWNWSLDGQYISSSYKIVAQKEYRGKKLLVTAQLSGGYWGTGSKPLELYVPVR